MKRSILLDTNVPNAYFDSSKPERQRETKRLWKYLPRFQVCISEVTMGEILDTEDIYLRENLAWLVKDFERLAVTEEALKLAESYIRNRVLTRRHINDLLQIAITTVNNLDVLLSWNFEHVVKETKIIKVNYTNELHNYKQIKILPPPMIF